MPNAGSRVIKTMTGVRIARDARSAAKFERTSINGMVADVLYAVSQEQTIIGGMKAHARCAE